MKKKLNYKKINKACGNILIAELATALAGIVIKLLIIL